MTAVRINFDAPQSEKEKVEALAHFDIQARKAARRLRTALAKIQLVEKSLDRATKSSVPSANELLAKYIEWVSEAVKWATTDPLAEKDKPKARIEKKNEPKAKKAAAASKKSEPKRAAGQLKELRTRLKKEVKEDNVARVNAALDAQKKR